ncbi:DUF6303 family protein [Streptomyces sp. NPDC001422]|uniref:DUF6303 family protein n=1 Tax=Streptomyces sp. NPDC001422 TaxID=3364575 RepID=UPI0036C4AF74
MEREFTRSMAHLSLNGGRWLLFVALRGAPGASEWPEHSFDEPGRLPTFTERVQALSVLGFEPVPGAVWEWTEFATDPADPASPVHPLGYIWVGSRQEAAA